MTGSASEETVLWQGRPAIRSLWVFILGMLLCGIGPYVREDPPLGPTAGLIFAAIFLLLILVRLAHVYTLTDRRIVMEYGLIGRGRSEILLADIHGVDVHQGFGLRVAGTGHLMVRSGAAHQSSIIIYGQANPYELQERLQELSRAAQRSSAPSAGASDNGPGSE